MLIFKKILCFCAFIKEIWNDMENFKELSREELSIVEIEIQSGVFCVIKKSQGIKLTIKDFDCLHIDESDITRDKNGDKYYREEWCADSKV